MPDPASTRNLLLSGRSDANVRFRDLVQLLHALGFVERIRGDHYIFTHEGIPDIINIQPMRGGKAKVYQVRQVRALLLDMAWEAILSRYELVIWWSDDDEAFLAEVPELPGCIADGGTYEEVLANVQTVIREWIETARELGRPVPEPRGRLMYA